MTSNFASSPQKILKAILLVPSGICNASNASMKCTTLQRNDDLYEN
jgi:hypothetical protein